MHNFPIVGVVSKGVSAQKEDFIKKGRKSIGIGIICIQVFRKCGLFEACHSTVQVGGVAPAPANHILQRGGATHVGLLHPAQQQPLPEVADLRRTALTA